MTYSLRRVLAVRFSLTMFVALTVIAVWGFLGVQNVLEQQLGATTNGPAVSAIAEINRGILIIRVGTVLLGTLATAFGAYWLARSAVAPVLEIASQARAITPRGQGARITAHAHVAEYASLVAVLNDLLDRADRAFIAQQRLLSDVGHELRTPLTALQGGMEVALRGERSPAEYQAVLRSSLEEIGRLSELCDAVLLLTRAEARTLVPHLTPTDLNEVAREAVARQAGEFSRKGVLASTRAALTNSHLLLDRRLVERLVRQLVDNALKFSPPGGSVTVGTEATPEGARLWIEDTGPGIASADLAHLFEPFYRSDPARSRGEGTGLGLAVAASIARLHGGDIRASNRREGGARFEVDLPARAA